MYSLSEENYLKAIYHLQGETGEAVSTNAIADRMETKASSVTDMIKKLSEKTLVTYVKYQGVHLTEEGRLAALKVIRKHRLWEVFLVEKLQFTWDQVHAIAEQLEHIQSEQLIDRLNTFLGDPKFDPHGDPIPDKDGNFSEHHNKVLADLTDDDKGVCVGVKESDDQFLQYLNRHKIGIGSQITVLDKEEYDGSMLIQIAGKELFISGEIANNIYIN
ncbi:MAG: metal-dependent transcriptional regulator [Gilvibacter sp.]